MRTSVHEKRSEKRISRCELVRLTGLSESHITRIERNEVDPQIGTLAKIAKALGVKVADLIEEDATDAP